MKRDWIRIAVADGLEGLLALRLKNTPAEDMIELTADIWVHAFARRVSVESIDAPRIREGFMLIFPRIREWPAPVDVIDLMPDRPPQPRLLAPELSDEKREENSRKFDEILRGLADKAKVPVESPVVSQRDRVKTLKRQYSQLANSEAL